MISYSELLNQLRESADADYRAFNARIVNVDPSRMFGVRVPILRRWAKSFAAEGREAVDRLIAFPDDYFEVSFLKCVSVGYIDLTVEELIGYLNTVLPVIDNWAICDCAISTMKTIGKNREAFLPYLRKCAADPREFVQRFAYVCLLSFYTDSEYFATEFELMARADCSQYYIHMAVAWLLAEILVKGFDEGVRLIRSSTIPRKTLNKGIQKACESFRLTADQKKYLKTLKK